ncbi:uncharacterized protein DEA37_0011363 [Paragonimus westermani]|uniref:Uncharacterized protein n=1 Tax=Paragonimus westermani TaxID=34504 RepID=A0A5J4P1C8_9TREM|nr:uncharacterized protein DEA37_0011363 [Paragonimus westermani]
MSDLDELIAHGFEIVKDETGQSLVKLIFMDENDEATGYALVSPEDAKKIISGEATLQNVSDDEGKQVLTLAPVDNEQQAEINELPIVKDSAEVGSHPTIPGEVSPDHLASSDLLGKQCDMAPTKKSDAASDASALHLSQTEKQTNDTDSRKSHDAAEAEISGTSDVGEQFVLSEQTAIVDNVPTQVVTLLDAQGRVLDQKHGKSGEQVVLEMHGQMFSYELQGPSATGEPITSTLLVSSTDPEAEELTAPDTHSSANATSIASSWPEQPAVGPGMEQDSEAAPAGQQFTLTEAAAIVDGVTMQAVILADENGNVLDQKHGRTGEHVIIEMSGSSLEYVFLGPTENGEPIITTLVVTSDPDSDETGQPDDAMDIQAAGVTEALATAANWCPSGLPPEFYSVLCRQVENIVATRIPRNADGTSIYRPEPYHRKLGSQITYQQMADLVNTYSVGASQGETLARYENLRNLAKIYRPSGPQSRALTKYEIAMNEAAAQICRHQPGLLFHKRELFHLAKETVEQSQTFLTNERRLQQQAQENTCQFQQPQLTTQTLLPKTQPVEPPRTLPPPTVAVGGRVASSQLAMLESRGLSSVKQPPVSMSPSTVPPFSIASTNEASPEQSTLATSQPLGTGTAYAVNDLSSKSRTPLGENNVHYYSGVPVIKRDPGCKLTLSQEEALRNAALDIIADLPHYELKSKVECTNIELACWEQAKQLASQTHLDETIDNTALHSSITTLISDENRLNTVRDAAAVYGRAPGGISFPPTSSGLPRSPPVGALIPYEIACNEAAAYLASAIPQLLTHRRELSELAKKVVRNSGCAFTNSSNMDKLAVGGSGYRFYCSEQLPELDLSAADHLLTDPLDRSDSPDSGCCLNSVDTMAENITLNFQTLALSCEECNNIIDDVAIYTATGTDSLKKVRILNLSDCAFTGMVPMHLNQCSNLIELNLSGNALYAFPRCLHLPKLKRLNLRNNIRLLRPTSSTSVIEPPLVEQFPRLVSVELDPPLVKLLSRQSLACLCPYLKTINGEEFVEEPSEDTIKAIQAAKHQLSTLIYSKWEDDISGFYKKGLPKRDTIRVIETLVLHAVKRSVDIKEPFSHCASVLARRVAEDFLSPKMLDDECEDETTEKMQHTGELSDDDEVADSDTEDGDEAESVRTDGADDLGGPAGDTTAPEKDSVTTSKSKLPPRRKIKKLVSTEAAQAASVAEREALAAAANLALLPDEPPDRLINVVGQALRHGKTVVYAVIRTAARQPNGELIPVGGGLGITSSNASADTGSPSGVIHPVASRSNVESIANTFQAHYEDELPTQPSKPSVTASKRAAKPLLAQQHSKPATAAAVSRRQTQQSRAPATQPTVSTTPVHQPTGAISLYSRRPGLLSRTPATPATANTTPPAQKITRAPAVVTTVAQLAPALTGPVYTLQQRRLLPSDYIIRPSQSESQPAYVVPNILVQSKPANWTPGRRGRPPVAHSMAKKAAAAEAEAAETSKLIENLTIPPPHAPPPPTMRMSTRDSNRLKRFSAYGVIDTAAALAGKEEALLAAALAQEDEKETDAARQIIEQSATASPEEDPEVIAALSKAREDAMVVVLEADTSGWTVSNEVKVLQEAGEQETIESSKKRKRRGTDSLLTPSRERTSDSDSVPQSPASITGRKRVSKAQSPRPIESKRASVNLTEDVLIACRQNGEAAKRVHSLTQLGTVVDYDPLHFIRCHARDNDPLDCETKVWRCSFEPSVDSVCSETSNVVATCGGECVCLIDCRSGRVMKRFKHLGEEFYSLAWTTVEMAAGHKTNLLAAAGKLREIRLLHPEQLVCYAEMRGHKDDIACMIFNPDKPTILFSGDSKAVVLVWDIGIPSAPEYRTRHQLLMRLVCFRPNLNPVLNLIFLPKYDVLIAGCEDGVFSWTLQEFKKEKLSDERNPDLELKVPTRREPCFDGLAKLTDDLVVVKCVEEGEIYVFDYSQVVQRSKRLVGSKKLVNVEIRGQLRWQTTEEIYINVTARSGLNAVVCGDNEGTIWLYDLQKQVEEDARRFKLKPVKILEWPECSIGGAKEEDTQMKESITSGFKNPVVNATDISHDGQYLAAVTDNNLVCIWKFSG